MNTADLPLYEPTSLSYEWPRCDQPDHDSDRAAGAQEPPARMLDVRAKPQQRREQDRQPCDQDRTCHP